MERSYGWSYGDTSADSRACNVLWMEIRSPGRADAAPAGRARTPYGAADEVECACPFCAVHNLVPIATTRAA